MPLTKQLRISDHAQIRSRIAEFAGKKINIVLRDNRVIVGDLAEVKIDGIVVKNMRMKKMFFSFDQLSEIYFDTIVS